MPPDEELASLVRAQAGVATRSQLALLGYDDRRILSRTRSSRWQALGSHVVLMQSGRPTPKQSQWAAVLHGGPDAALHGLTALEAAGLSGFAAPVMHVVVEHGTRVPPLDAAGIHVRVHQTRRPVAESVLPTATPPRQRTPHALLAAAQLVGSADRARLLVLSSVQQGLVRTRDVRAVLDDAPRVMRRRLLLEVLDDADGGQHSLPEREFALVTRRAGLPAPTAQRRIRRPDGRSWYLDNDYEEFAMSVEVNGRQHDDVVHSETDHHRRNVMGTIGRLVITLSSHIVRHDHARTVLVTAAGLLSRGWVPPPRVLARLLAQAASEGYDLRTGDRVRLA